MATAMTKPVIVLVPGMASVGTVVYQPLLSELTALGWDEKDLVAVDNPSVDTIKNKSDIKPNALEADIKNLRKVLIALIEEQNRDVLLVAHSYGGAPSLSAARDLWRDQRSQGDKTGGVVKVALIAAGLPLPGTSVARERAEWLQANNMPPDVGSPEIIDGEPFLNPTGFENFWMNDIDDEKYRSSLRPAALSSAMANTAVDDIDPQHWKINYLILTELDLAMPVPFQRHLIDRARKLGATIDDTAELRSGHFAQISHATEVAKWVVSLT